MRWLLTVASHRASGAAAAAVALGRALGSAGEEVRLLHQLGRGAPTGFETVPWAEDRFFRERRFGDLRKNLRALALGARWADVVVTHLPHDHLLSVLAGANRHATLIRSYRHPRHLRTDPFHRWIAGRAAAGLAAHSAMLPALRHLSPAPARALPTPLADRFQPIPEARSAEAEGLIVGAMGKLAEGRGFEVVLEACARVTKPVSLVIIGHGERQGHLEELAWNLGLGRHVHWAGKREADLPSLLSSLDAFIFAAAGSDHGHRAITEAQACGCPVIAVDMPGVADLIADGVSGVISEDDPDTLARSIESVLGDPSLAQRLSDGAIRAAAGHRDRVVAAALAEFVEQLPTRAGLAEE